MSIENPELSFEFFPPRTPKGFENLSEVRDALAKFGPSFFSVTYGAGGSTQDGTFEAVKAMLDAGHDAAPHLTCVGASRDLIRTTVSVATLNTRKIWCDLFAKSLVMVCT